MEAEPAVSDWIELEDEAGALKARVNRMERRVSFVRNQTLANLTEASAYQQALCLSPYTPPVTHPGQYPFTFTRARTPTHLDPLGPQWDPLDAMDCSEDAQRGMDGKADTPSSRLNMLLTQHSEKAAEEPHSQSVDAPDLSVIKVLIGDHAKPLGTHLPCPRTRGVVASGQARITGAGLVAEVALEGSMPTGDDYLQDMRCPSGGGYLASQNGPPDTPLPPMFPPYALSDEWLDVFAKLSAIPRLTTHGNAAAQPSNLLGCGSFAECVD